MPLSRRQLLGAMSVAVVSASLDLGAGPARSAVASTADGLAVLNFTSTNFYRRGFGERVTWRVANFVEVSGVPEKVDRVSLAFTVDKRLFKLSDQMVILANGGLQRHPVEGVVESGNQVTGTVTIPRGQALGTELRALIPVYTLPLYPADNVEGAAIPRVEVVVEVTGQRRRAFARDLATETSESGLAAWGVLLDASFTAVAGGGEGARSYRCPVAIRVRSTGPNPVPAGLKLTVNYDPKIENVPTLVRYLGRDQELAPDVVALRLFDTRQTRGLDIVLNEGLPAGDERSIILGWGTLTTPSLDGTELSSSVVVPSEQALGGAQRDTGQAGSAQDRPDLSPMGAGTMKVIG